MPKRLLLVIGCWTMEKNNQEFFLKHFRSACYSVISDDFPIKDYKNGTGRN